jgi:YHS domain-containing protein
MKKLLYILASSMFLLWSCEPLEDTYDELDQEKGAYSEDVSVTLSDDDYNTLSGIAGKLGNTEAADYVDENMAFSEQYPAADFVPSFLDETYIALKDGSSANVTFNYMEGNPEYVSAYIPGDNSELNVYSVGADDYAAIGGDVAAYEMFFASNPPENNIPTILNGQYPDAGEGTRVLAQFKYAEEVSSSPTVALTMAGDDYQIIVDAVAADPDKSGLISSYGNDEYYYGANAHYENFDANLYRRVEGGQYAQEEYFDLTDEEGEALIAERIQEGINILLQSKYPDAKATINGNQVYYIVTYDTYDGSGNTYNVSYIVDEEGSPATFELLDGPTTETLAYSSSPTVYNGVYYEYDGSEWRPEEDVYYLSSEEYNQMGAPGNYDNFSSSVSPDDYLPAFIEMKKPFAQEGDKVVVGYKYYSGSTTIRASEYVFNGTQWQNSSRIVERTEQFVHNGNEWVFDPTMVFTMTTSDYELIVDYVKTEIDGGADYLNSYGTGEFYFGADAYYENFDLRLSNRTENNIPGFQGLSTDEAVALSYERLTEAVEVLLNEKYPDATAQVNGVDVHYIVTVDTYENDLSRGLYTFNFQCVKSAPNPEFELIEGPEF